jgi:exodeoxyribonuclease V alpha subunit
VSILLCSFKRLIYPKNPDANPSGYMIGIYTVHEKLLDGKGNKIPEVKVVGYYLPVTDGIRFKMNGRWTKNDKHGTQFKMDSYQEVIQPDRTGIIAYLSSGHIKGIGPKTAIKIYEKFGDQTLDILDNHPEELENIPGISENKLKRICDSYLASRGARDIVAFFAPHGVTPNRAVKILRKFGKNTMQLIRENPYRLSDMDGIGFMTADKIAVSMGVLPDSDSRIDAGMLHTIKEAESCGHLCMEKTHFVNECVKLLNTDGVDYRRVAERAFIMLKNNELAVYGNYVYRTSTAQAEKSVADNINNLLSFGPIRHKSDLDAEINKEERKLSLKLASEQRQAVKTCLTSRLCVITGGPGTGKTLIQKVLLSIYKKLNPDANIVCCAPTGKAARRMEQCTGLPSATIHKTLGLMAGDDEAWGEPEPLEADFVLIDEFSMVDIHIAKYLLECISCGTQVAIIGDSDQLPSVGPGAVLSELVSCGRIPVVKLDKVFRQNEGSRIAVNAKLIRHNNLSLEYGSDFQFIESNNYDDSADIIEKLFQTEVNIAGIDNVALLTPFRTKTETGVNALNGRLREKINPAAEDKPEAARGKRLFRLGDKVMQIKNRGEVNNGDVGYVIDISRQGGDVCVTVDYGDGRISEYEDSDLDMLELAYACTVHKSQGSEYATVIISIQNGHYIMLKRPLIYTAITRAKQKVIIVGERKALCIAINTVDTEKRCTMLASRINDFYTDGNPQAETNKYAAAAANT